MKKIIFTFLLAMTAVFANAQQKDYNAKLSVLIKSAENDFVDIIGEQTNSVEGINSYDSKVKFGIGEENLIIDSSSPKEVVYSVSVPKSESKNLEKTVNNHIKKHFSNAQYDVIKKVNKHTKTYTIKVYEKNTQKLILETGLDEIGKDKTPYYGLVILGKSVK